MSNNKTLKIDRLEEVGGIFRSFNKGDLIAYENKIVWEGNRKVEMNIKDIISTSMGYWHGVNTLDITLKNEVLRLYAYKNIGMFTATDNSYHLIKSWVELIDKMKNNISNSNINDPIVNLKNRLSLGEITVEEFEKLKKVLEL